MQQKTDRSSATSPIIESLESRTHLCAGASVTATTATSASLEQPAILKAAKTAKEVTHTSMKVQAGTLGQAITFTFVVKTAASFGSPTGTINLLDHGSTVQSVSLSPITSTNPKFAMSNATITQPAGAGEPSYFIGSHHVTAAYVPGASELKSTAAATFTVKSPKYVRHSDGLKVATVGTGSGTGIAAGQTATMEYTGYLAKGGKVFDDSTAHTDTVNGFPFVVEGNPEQVIPGFDEGSLGMEVGETRVLSIPSKLGYGTSGSGSSIPPNANLVFLITLVSIT